MIRNTAISIICAMALAGCSKEPPPAPVIVEAEPSRLPLPAECNPKTDPAWARLPDRALKKSDMPRHDAQNGRAFTTIAGRRRDCWAVLAAQK